MKWRLGVAKEIRVKTSKLRVCKHCVRLKTSTSTGWPLAMELIYECLKLRWHSKNLCQSRRNHRKVRINRHLAENRMDNCAGLVWDPSNKRVYETGGVITEL